MRFTDKASRTTTRSLLRRLQSAVFLGLTCAADAIVVSASKPGKRVRRGEQLEPRLALSGGGLVPLGSQPSGALTGKIVYTHAGHGWTADNLGNGHWTTQRGEHFEIVEDLGNQDQMTFFVDYLFRAGATIVPLRPVGHQIHEVVLDNDDVGVTFVGDWSDSSAPIFFGSAGDVPYRFASTASTETAYARYRPDIPTTDFYPVYAWTRYGSDRASDQLYRVHHSGGTTEVQVNHRRVGNGLIYLGTYHFAVGLDGYVDISNQSSELGRVAIADMIRFGNGMGDIDRGGGVSGQPREDEAGLYWVQWHVDHSQGISSSEYRATSNDRDATVSLSPRYAEYMNRAADGALKDRVFVSFHSNAGGTASRGVLALYNGNNNSNTRTPNQVLLANTLGREVNDDLVAQNGRFEHNWFHRSTVILDRGDIEFGEINNLRINNEFDATIVETGFHDNRTDAELMRDPKVRDAIGRATYQGLVRYFHSLDDGKTPLVMAPGPVSDVMAETTGPGSVRLTWTPPVTNVYQGDAATEYMIYTSRDGFGFDGGTLVSGSNTTSHPMDELESDGGPYYFKVAAVNAGGESAGSEVVVAQPANRNTNILVVNGFDRLDRPLNPRQPYQGGQIDRVRPRQSNSFDYAVQVGRAIADFSTGVAVDGTANENVALGRVSLDDYDAVVWILGEESSVDDTFDANEQVKVSDYLANGGRLFVSGAEIAWDLDHLENGRAFYNGTLRANYVSDDAGTYDVRGVADSVFAGMSFSFDDGTRFYDAQFPDRLVPGAGAIRALDYVGGLGGGAGVQLDGGTDGAKLIMLGFPFETITDDDKRNEVLARSLEFFDIQIPSTTLQGDFDDDGDLDSQDVDVLTRQIAAGGMNTGFDLTEDNQVNHDDLRVWVLDLKGTLFGDVNLDYSVNAKDFGIWSENRFLVARSWSTGDLNADGLVDVSDFNIWNENRFTMAAATASIPTNFEHRESIPRAALRINTVLLYSQYYVRPIPVASAASSFTAETRPKRNSEMRHYPDEIMPEVLGLYHSERFQGPTFHVGQDQRGTSDADANPRTNQVGDAFRNMRRWTENAVDEVLAKELVMGRFL